MDAAADSAEEPVPNAAAPPGDEPVRLVPHDPAWAEAFEHEAARLRSLLHGRLVEVRHVGSTAVPGLAAKPVVDMIAGLRDFGEVEPVTATLQGVGWTYLPDSAAQSPDRRWLLLHDGRARTHHLHLVRFGSRAWLERIAFCEMLKSDAALRAEYEALKRHLVACFAGCREAYTAAKAPFIIQAVHRALGGKRGLRPSPPSLRHAMQAPDDPSAAPRSGTLPRELLDEFVRAGTARVVPKNTLVVRQGDPAQTLYVILEGRVRVFVSNEDGKDAELNVMGKGEYFGELMLASHRRTASVKTLVPSRLCMVDRQAFERILAARPDLAFHLIQTLIERVKALTEAVSGLALMDVYGRVVRLFLELAETVDGRQRVPAMSQQAIAEQVGASRSMVNRLLKDLTEGGYLTLGKDHIEIHRALPRRW